MNSSAHPQFVSLMQVVKKLAQLPSADWIQHAPTCIQSDPIEIEHYATALSLSSAANRLLKNMIIADEIRAQDTFSKSQIPREPWVDAGGHPSDHPDGLRAEIRLLLQFIVEWPVRIQARWRSAVGSPRGDAFLREKDRKRSKEIKLDEHSARQLVIGIADRWERSVRQDKSWPEPESDTSKESPNTADAPNTLVPTGVPGVAATSFPQAGLQESLTASIRAQPVSEIPKTSSKRYQLPHRSTNYIIDLAIPIVSENPEIGLGELRSQVLRILDEGTPNGAFLGKEGENFKFKDTPPRDKLNREQIKTRIKSNLPQIQSQAREMQNGKRKISAQ